MRSDFQLRCCSREFKDEAAFALQLRDIQLARLPACTKWNLTTIIFLFAFLSYPHAKCRLQQTSPSAVGVPVTFEVLCDDNNNTQIAWEFGDSDSRTPYSGKHSISHTYTAAGEYNVFVRIKGELLPLSILHRVIRGSMPGNRQSSSTVVWNKSYSLVYAVNTDNQSITGIEVGTWRKVEIAVGKEPRNLTFDNDGNIWVTNQNDASLSIVSAKERREIGTVVLPYGSRPFGIVSDTIQNILYISLEGTGEVIAVDPALKKITRSTVVFPTARGLALDMDNRKIYVSRFISPQNRGEIAILNIPTLAVHKIITLAPDPGPNSESSSKGIPNGLSNLAFSADGKRLYIPSTKANTRHGLFIDGESLSFETTLRTIVSQVDIPSESEILSARFDLDNHSMLTACTEDNRGDILYCVTQGTNTLQGLSAATDSAGTTLKKYRSYEPEPGRGQSELAPKGLALNSGDSLMAVHFFTSREIGFYDVSQINGGSIQLVKIIPTVSQEALSEEVLFGKQIFYNAEDARMTKEGYISCAACHLDNATDGRVWDFTERGEGLRATISLLGRGGMAHGPVHHTANFDEIQDFEHDIRNAFLGKGFLSDMDFNTGTRNQPLGDKKAGLSPDLDALASYLKSLTEVNDSPFRNADGTMTASAQRGKVLFNSESVGCFECHSGPNFTDSRLKSPFTLHDVGTAQISSGKRLYDSLTGFDTPTLKGIWQTAPYLHDGSAGTLMDVITAKNPEDKHGRTSQLSLSEKNDLVRYLLELDDSESVLTAKLPPRQNSHPESKISLSQGEVIFPRAAKWHITIHNVKGEKLNQTVFDGNRFRLPDGMQRPFIMRYSDDTKASGGEIRLQFFK